MKNLKPYLALISLIIVLFFAIREKHNIEKISDTSDNNTENLSETSLKLFRKLNSF